MQQCNQHKLNYRYSLVGNLPYLCKLHLCKHSRSCCNRNTYRHMCQCLVHLDHRKYHMCLVCCKHCLNTNQNTLLPWFCSYHQHKNRITLRLVCLYHRHKCHKCPLSFCPKDYMHWCNQHNLDHRYTCPRNRPYLCKLNLCKHSRNCCNRNTYQHMLNH